MFVIAMIDGQAVAERLARALRAEADGVPHNGLMHRRLAR